MAIATTPLWPCSSPPSRTSAKSTPNHFLLFRLVSSPRSYQQDRLLGNCLFAVRFFLLRFTFPNHIPPLLLLRLCWSIPYTNSQVLPSFSQMHQNYISKSAEGLSITFVIIWLAGDALNAAGAWFQGLLWTMVSLLPSPAIFALILISV